MSAPARPQVGDRVMVMRAGKIKRAIVDYGGTETLVVRFPDETEPAVFSSTARVDALQMFPRTIMLVRNENQTWVRGWREIEEVEAIFAAEALR